MSKKRIWLLASFVVLALGVGGASVVYAAGGGDGLAPSTAEATPAITGSCVIKKLAYATHENNNSTTSTTFVDLPGGTVTFTAGRGSQCVVVNFSSVAYAPNHSILNVRAVLDGSVVGTPADTQFVGGSGTRATTHAAQFVFASVAQGPHTVQIQFRSVDAITVTLSRGVTTVASR